jgi:hypothetical protein
LLKKAKDKLKCAMKADFQLETEKAHPVVASNNLVTALSVTLPYRAKHIFLSPKTLTDNTISVKDRTFQREQLVWCLSHKY